MNKNFLVSAVLLASSIGSLTAAEADAVHGQALSPFDTSKRLNFTAAAPVTTSNGTYRVELSLIPAKSGDYDFVQDEPGSALGKTPGIDPGLEYQIVVKLVDVATGKTQHTDAKYFAKVQDGGKIKAYYCDTTAVCSEDRGTTDLNFEAGVLTITGGEFFDSELSGTILFTANEK